MSWALPELPPAPCSPYAWGRSDLGQTGSGRDESSATPQMVQALQGKGIVHAAGSSYNSAFVTSAHLPLSHMHGSPHYCPISLCK